MRKSDDTGDFVITKVKLFLRLLVILHLTLFTISAQIMGNWIDPENTVTTTCENHEEAEVIVEFLIREHTCENAPYSAEKNSFKEIDNTILNLFQKDIPVPPPKG